mgnify:CR=1 FL=1
MTAVVFFTEYKRPDRSDGTRERASRPCSMETVSIRSSTIRSIRITDCSMVRRFSCIREKSRGSSSRSSEVSRAWREMELRGFLISWATVSGRWTWHYQGSAVADSVPPEGAAAGYIPSDENREHCRRQYLQRQTPEGYLPAGLLPWQKELQCSGNGMQPDTVPYKGKSPAGKRSERVFFQHQHGKNNSKHKECRHAATITAAGKKHHRKNDQKNHDNGDQVAALIFSTVIGIKKKPSGDCNQRKIDQYISPGTGPELRKAMIRLITVPPKARMLNSRTRKSRMGLNKE